MPFRDLNAQFMNIQLICVGLDVQGLSDAVTAFYSRIPVEEDEDDDDNAEAEVDILFSLKPPGSGSNGSTQSSDPQHVEKLWTWLTEHPDIELRTSNKKESKDATSAKLDSAIEANPLGPVLLAHANERLYANENITWNALTDHGVDYRRIPKLEFVCLSAIAAAGPEGLLQPEVTRITGQDKRSVPKRTDALAQKGLITKELCVGLGIKTSLLRFKKFIQQGDAPTMFEVGESSSKRAVGSGVHRMIRYDDWFVEIVAHLKKHNSLMAYDDLRKEMVSLLVPCGSCAC